MTTQRRVLVLLSTYNGEKFLAEQLESILNQSHPHLDLLVRDDGSTDGTTAILLRYVETGRLTYYTGSNLGVVASFLDLTKKADKSYDYFAFCDQDDYWEPKKIERALDMLALHDDNLPLVYGSQIKIVDKNLAVLRERYDKSVKKTDFENAMLENVITGCTAVFNGKMRSILDTVTETNDFFMHDWLLYLIGSSMGKIVYDQNAYLLYRQHEHNVLGAETNFNEKVKQKLGRLKKYITTDIIYKNNAAFYNSFQNMLPPDKKNLLLRYLKKNKNLYERINLALFSGLYRQRPFDSFVFKLLIVLGII